MVFNIQSTNQCEVIEENLKGQMYKGLYESSKKNGWTCLTGLASGIASGLITVVSRIALIGESLIKGFGNMLGSPFTNKCSFSRGARQLLSVPLNLCRLPIDILKSGMEIFENAGYMTLDPILYSKIKWLSHDPVEQEKLSQQDFSEKIKDLYLDMGLKSEIVEFKFKANMYKELNEASKKTEWIRIVGFPTAMASGIITIATKVALVAECVIRGLVNVLGAAFSSQCSLRKGLSQIIYSPANLISLIPIPNSLLYGALYTLTETIYMAASPQDYTSMKQENYSITM